MRREISILAGIPSIPSHDAASRRPTDPGAAVTRTGERISIRSSSRGADMVRAGRARLRGYAAIAVVLALVASGCGWLHGAAVVRSPDSRRTARRGRCDPDALRPDLAAVHAPVPERPLHRSRSEHTHGSPARALLRFAPHQRFRRRRSTSPTRIVPTAGARARRSWCSFPGSTSPHRACPASPTPHARSRPPHPSSCSTRPPTGVCRSGPSSTRTRIPAEPPVLFIRPASNFEDGHRIVVGLRRLVDASHQRLVPTPAFAAYRDGQRTTDATFESRRPAMDRLFVDLALAGVRRRDLQLAWDFTVASTKSLTGRMLAIRDDAFHALGSATPRTR